MSVHWHMATWDRLCERCEKRPALPYATWRRAFELASDDGAVAFH